MNHCGNRPALALALVGCVFLSAAGPSALGDSSIRLDVQVGRSDGANVPVCAKISLPKELAGASAEDIRVALVQEGGAKVAAEGQIVKLPDGSAQLWWILPKAEAGGKSTWAASLSRGPYKGKAGFSWRDKEGEHLDLLYAGKAVTRYMYARDTSTKKRAHETYKVYHHVFDAAGGDVITKAVYGKYPHHRGIFIGFCQLGYDGRKRGDWWGMGGGNTQVHRKFLEKTAGPVLARSASLVHWNDRAGEPVVVEQRQVTVYAQPAPAIVLLDFHTRLQAARSDVLLGGDPEHAGMQFRPHNDVDKNATKYYFHKDGIKTGGQRLNENRDLPWAAETFVLKGHKYSAQHMNHPDNPKGTRYSAYRNYGRFGAFPSAEIKSGQKLALRYRICVLDGEMPPRADLAVKRAAFADPPKVTVRK